MGPQDNNDNVKPFDGVIPTEYPDTYMDMLSKFCIRSLNPGEQFRFAPRNCIICCNTCYKPRYFYDWEVITTHRDWHESRPIGSLSLRCFACRKPLLHIRPIFDCGICTNLYFETKNM